MNLSDAIRKRNELAEKGRKMDEWYTEQRHGQSNIPWHEMNKAIKKIIDDTWEEYMELNQKIEAFIEGMEIK